METLNQIKNQPSPRDKKGPHSTSRLVMSASLIIVVLILGSNALLKPVAGQISELPQSCADFAFSTEEDFVTQNLGATSGSAIISDGDLLGASVVCARNRDLLQAFGVEFDLGLDAADVIDTSQFLVAFSTELASPQAGQFKEGDLLITNGTVIPNLALTQQFNINYDIGLDAVHFVGEKQQIIGFLENAAQYTRDHWLATPDALFELLEEYDIDIWFSSEGTVGPRDNPNILDGDLLSARGGNIVASNANLMQAGVPAGIPNDGVDFGLDAASAPRQPNANEIRFSSEILYRDTPTLAFNDGDVLQYNNGVVIPHNNFIAVYEPYANFLGLDALHLQLGE